MNLRKVYRFLTEEVWTRDLSRLKKHEAYLVSAWKLLYSIARQFRDFQLQLRTMSLVYTTLLSIVPLLAVSFSVLQAFGVHNQIAPFLSGFLKPLGPQGAVITNKIIEYIGRIKVGVLSTIGLSLLFYSMIGVIYKIEEALNYIWRVGRPRSFSRRFSEYLSILLVGPILMFSAVGMTAAIQSNALVKKVISIGPLGYAYVILGHLVPYITTCAAFTFVYILMPNTKVKVKSALAGGIFAGVAWEVTGWAFAKFIASSSSYSAIYAGFAILLLSMMWLYWSWLIFLVGGSVSFFYQYPHLAGKRGTPGGALSGSARERLTVLAMYLIGYNFYFGKPPWTLNTLSDRLGLPVDVVQEAVSALEGE
ncbi:MAG: YihY/virulence factor BrkB family protein, partial [Nitrospirota bacterium]